MTQGDALGWELMALQAVDDALVIADVRGRKRCPGLGLMALQAVDLWFGTLSNGVGI